MLLPGVVATALITTARGGQEAGALLAKEQLTLEEFLAVADERNPQLAAARARVEAAEGRRRQAALWPNPSLEATVGDLDSADFDDESGKWSVHIAQPVVIGGRLEAASNAAAAEVAAAREDLRATRRQIFRRVRDLHCRVQYLRRLRTEAGRMLALAEEVVELAGTEGERARAEVAMLELELEVTGAVAGQVFALQELEEVLGGADLTPDQVAGTLGDELLRKTYGYDREEMLGRHPERSAALWRVEAGKRDRRTAQRDVIPDVTVRIGGGYNERLDETFASAGLSVPLPLWNREQGRIAAAEAEISRREAEVIGVEAGLRREWLETYQRLNEVDTFVSEYRIRVVPTARRAFEETRARHREGAEDFTALLDTLRVYTEAVFSEVYWLNELLGTHHRLRALVGEENEGRWGSFAFYSP